MYLIKQDLMKIIAFEEAKLNRMKEELKGIKGGNVYIRKRGKKIYYTETVNGVEKGITSDPNRVQLLLRKKYLKQQIKYIQRELEILKNTCIELNKIPKPRTENMLDESKYSQNQLKWMKTDYPRNERYPEHLQYTSQLGTVVRSKSELLIANTLEKMGIPYRYEQKAMVTGLEFYPDFTLLRPDGSKIIFEHFGRMDDANYASNAFHKIELYQEAGYKQHTNLICTTEEDIKVRGLLEEIIERFVY